MKCQRCDQQARYVCDVLLDGDIPLWGIRVCYACFGQLAGEGEVIATAAIDQPAPDEVAEIEQPDR